MTERERMTKADRDNLIRLVRLRARQAKQETETRERILLAEVEDQVAAEYSRRDELWAEAIVIAEEAARKANELIVARCADLGIPASQAPTLNTYWMSRSRSFGDPKRRAELRKVAQTKLAALTKQAKTLIDAKALDVETALVVGGLETDEARDLVAALPTADQLIPALGLQDLGVKGWQPPEGVAGELLTPLTTADRKRRRILRAIEANPDASDRRIAELAGCDHKTVGVLRRERGELPTSAGEFPTESTPDGAP
ncbi:MAG TPA: hypothetical protein VFB74_15140 [Kribbellaceae bacterium]|nr:hypothetical protein [Kribbellaceae bacterium]